MVRKFILAVLVILAVISGIQVRSWNSNSVSGTPSLHAIQLDTVALIQRDTENLFRDNESGYHPGFKSIGEQRRSFYPQRTAWNGRRGESDQRRRSRSDQVSTDDLMKFLNEHEKELARRLEGLRKDRPRYFSDQVRVLKQLYSPVIRQMERDPKGGMFSLEKIRLRLKIPDAVEAVHRAERGSYNEAKKYLSGQVAQLFDVIVNEETYDVEEMEAWLNNREDRQWLSRSEYRTRQDYIDEKKEDIADWKKNKDRIVEQRVEKLLQEHRDFPWGDS